MSDARAEPLQHLLEYTHALGETHEDLLHIIIRRMPRQERLAFRAACRKNCKQSDAATLRLSFETPPRVMQDMSSRFPNVLDAVVSLPSGGEGLHLALCHQSPRLLASLRSLVLNLGQCWVQMGLELTALLVACTSLTRLTVVNRNRAGRVDCLLPGCNAELQFALPGSSVNWFPTLQPLFNMPMASVKFLSCPAISQYLVALTLDASNLPAFRQQTTTNSFIQAISYAHHLTSLELIQLGLQELTAESAAQLSSLSGLQTLHVSEAFMTLTAPLWPACGLLSSLLTLQIDSRLQRVPPDLSCTTAEYAPFGEVYIQVPQSWSRLQRLQHLHIEAACVSAVASLRSLTNLCSLTLAHSIDSSLEFLSSMLCLSHLQISFPDSFRYNGDIVQLPQPPISALPLLTHAILRCPRTNIYPQMASLHHLTFLTLEIFCSHDSMHLPSLSNLPSLHGLCLLRFPFNLHVVEWLNTTRDLRELHITPQPMPYCIDDGCAQHMSADSQDTLLQLPCVHTISFGFDDVWQHHADLPHWITNLDAWLSVVAAPNLQRVDFGGWHRLDELEQTGHYAALTYRTLAQLRSRSSRVQLAGNVSVFVDDSILRQLAEQCPEILREVFNTMQLACVSDGSCTEEGLDAAIRHVGSGLSSLRMWSFEEYVADLTASVVATLVECCPNLRHLHASAQFVTGTSLCKLVAGCSALQTLRLSQLHLVDPESLLVLCEGCPKLTQLSLDGCHRLSDEVVERLGCLPLLEVLVLSNCCSVTDDGVACLLAHVSNGTSKLMSFRLSGMGTCNQAAVARVKARLAQEGMLLCCEVKVDGVVV